MNNNAPETRLKDLEFEISNIESEELSASMQKEMSFRKAIENALPSGIAVMDDTGKQVYVNQAFCKIVGWEEEDLLGKLPPYIYWSQKDMVNINAAMEKTLSNNIPEGGFDLEFCDKNGKLIPVNVIISPFIQQDNKTFWLANVIDITRRKNNEEALIKSQLLMMSSLENQKGTIIFSIDRNYKYLYFNKAHSDAMNFAYENEIKIGMNFLDCISKDQDRKLLKDNIERALRGESHSVIQTFGAANIDYYEVFFNPIVNENNGIIGCTSLARIITSRVHAEQALKESETKFREIINQINDGIIVFDKEGKIIIWNQGAEKICGLKAGDVTNKNIVDIQFQFTPPAIRDRVLIDNRIKAIVEMKVPEAFNQIFDNEIISLHTPGLKNIQSTVFPIRLDGYNLFCVVMRDVSETKRYEKELQQIIEDKDKFYSIIAQYLYTPFSLFNNFSKLLAEDMDNLPIREIQKMAVMMSKSASNLFSLLDNMLQWTKMNQGKITYSPQKINFKTISRDAVSILKANADAKNLTINFQASEDISLYADIFMFKTILRNIVSNAINHSKDNGEISISARQKELNVTVTVADNGMGRTKENLAKLFSISSINKSLSQEDEKGTSLGLLLCKEFVEKHGGKIWAESENGKGTEFKFTIPAYSELKNVNKY